MYHTWHVLRAGFNEENTWTQLNFLNRIEWKNTNLGANGDHASFCFYFGELGKNAAFYITPGWQNQKRVDESDGIRRRVRAATSLSFFFRRRLGTFRSQSLLRGGSTKKPPAEQRRRCNDRSLGACPLCVGSISRFSCCLGDRAVWNIAIAIAMFFFEAPPPGYAVLFSVGVGAAGAPVAIRRGSRFITSSAIVVDK